MVRFGVEPPIHPDPAASSAPPLPDQPIGSTETSASPPEIGPSAASEFPASEPIALEGFATDNGDQAISASDLGDPALPPPLPEPAALESAAREGEGGVVGEGVGEAVAAPDHWPPPPPPGPSTPSVSGASIWRDAILDLIMVNGLAVILAVGVLLAMAFRNGFARMQFSGTMPPVVLAWAVLLTELLFYTFAWRRQRIHRKQGRTAPQLWQGATGKALLFGAAAGVSMILASAIYQSALKLLTGRLPVPEALKMLDSANEPWTTAILVFGISLLAPFCEEFFFRGTVLAAAEQAGRLRTGIIASACVFALGHMSLILFPYYVLFALVMAWLFLRTRTLVAPITAHVVLNGTACLLSLLNRDVTV